MRLNTLLHGVVLASLMANASASSSFYEGKAEGWFWYQDPVIEEELEPEKEPESKPQEKPKEEKPEPKKEEPLPDFTSSAPSEATQPEPLSAAWFRANMQVYLDLAIDNPTPENVEAYYLLQHIAMNKAEDFAKMGQRVVLGHAVLDETIAKPASSGGHDLLSMLSREEESKIFNELSNEIALLFFFDSECILCDNLAVNLQGFERSKGIQVTAISLNGEPLKRGAYPEYKTDEGYAEALGVTRSPAVVLMTKNAGNKVIARGTLSVTDLSERILLSLNEMGLVSDESMSIINEEAPKQEFNPEIDNLAEIQNDPAEFVKLLREYAQ